MLSQSLHVIRSRVLKGTRAQAFAQAVQVFIRLAEVPLLLAFWGAQLYGEWLMLAAIPAYLSIVDGGFATATCRDMTMKSGAGDRQGALVVFQSTWLLLLLVSFIVFQLTYSLTALAPITKWLRFSAMNASDTQAVLLLLVLHVLVGFQGGLLHGGFWATGKYPSGMVFSAATQLLEFMGLGLAVILGGGPVKAAAGYLGGRVLGTILMWIGQRRTCSWLRYGFAHASLFELQRLAIPAFSSLAFPLGNALNIQGTRIVVGLALGPVAVAIFAPLRTLSNLGKQPSAIINRLIEPEMALAYGAADENLFARIFFKSCQLSFWGFLLVALVIGAGAHWVFPVWTSGKVVMEWSTFILLLVAVLINSLWFTALMVPYATNRHARISVFYMLIYGGGSFLIAYFSSKGFGLNGTAAALISVEAVMALIVIRTALKMVHVDLCQWAVSVIKPPLSLMNHAAALFHGKTSIIPT